MSGATKWGSEFLVNTTTVGTQDHPAIAALADGRFVATWEDISQSGLDTWSWSIRGQVMNADGSKAGGELLVNTTTWDAQTEPAVVALPDGRFVAAWEDFSHMAGDTMGKAVRAQFFNVDGTKSGSEFVMNQMTQYDQMNPSLGVTPDGHIMATWEYAVTDVHGQVFNPNGTPSGAEVQLSASSDSWQGQAVVTGLAGGRFVAAWSDYNHLGSDSSDEAVRAQLFNADGTKWGAEFQVNTTTDGSQASPALAALSDGRFVAAWSDATHAGADIDAGSIQAQIFNADGSTSGSQILVNTTTAGGQYEPALTGLADGRFLAAWMDYSGPNADIRAQVFNADGSKSGAEVLVNTATAGDQMDVSVTTLADGRVVVSWTDESPSPGDPSTSVHAQILDPRDSAVTLAGSGLSDDYVGTGFNDTMVGNAGNDHLVGAGGNDFLWGGQGDDTMVGGSGDDSYVVDGASDVVSEQANGGADLVYANVSCTLAANVESLTLLGTASLNGTGNALVNTIYGNDGANLLNGAAGNDSLIGGSGDDTFTGGLGKDLMTGGGGLDHFKFTSLSESGTSFATRDVINTYAHGDKIDVSAIDANANAAGNQAFTFVTNFTHVAGQLEWTQTAPTGYLVQGDTNGDGVADFSVQLYAAPGFGTIHNWDFVL